jgi:sugar phosphate isomerase/epimerase
MNELGLLIKLTNKEGIVKLLERVKSFGFKTCQISTYVPELYTRETADIINGYCQKNDLRITLLWAGWPGNCEWNFIGGPDTVGLVPLQYRKERCAIMKKASDFAKLIGVDRIATHAGFIPENMKDPLYAGLIQDLKNVAQYCKVNKQYFCFETGQETPVTLLRVIQDIGTDNLGINLDPANLVMYGKGSPVDCLIVLGQYLKGVHIKDGKYPTDGKELGMEVSLGEGHVNMPVLLQKLKETGYIDPLTIEIELDRREGQLSAEEAIKKMVDYLHSHGV